MPKLPINTILGIESSCDDCSASVVQSGKVLSLITESQISAHAPFGGIVPEIASRSHLETINFVIDIALKESGLNPTQIDAVAVTNRPGLIGSLLVGVSAAKALSYVWKKPLIPIHHLEGHCMSVFLEQDPNLEFPALFAIVSGGHTNLYLAKESPLNWSLDWLETSLLGKSRDDAAGEAFDKTAKLVGFPYPGGIWIDQTAKKGGNPKAFSLPRPMLQKDTLDFSFSGLKTAAVLLVQELRGRNELDSRLPDLCASIQEAIVDTLIGKIKTACSRYSPKSIVLVGGVAANSRLREKLKTALVVPVIIPHLKFCMDNAAMIAAAGGIRLAQGHALSGKGLMTLGALSQVG